jgi:hypothetical protein
MSQELFEVMRVLHAFQQSSYVTGEVYGVTAGLEGLLIQPYLCSGERFSQSATCM